jgi:hypothetical protein
MISQAKVDLAVLWKLYQHSENGGESITPNDVQRLFTINMSPRRIELALNQLESEGSVDKEYHPYHFEEGLWAVSRKGLVTVERAIRVPTSFIGRLAANGDTWLESEEAQNAVLKKLPAAGSTAPANDPSALKVAAVSSNPPITIHNNFSPSAIQSTQVTPSDNGSGRSAAAAGWFGAWGTWIAGAVALAGLLWVLHVAKVF